MAAWQSLPYGHPTDHGPRAEVIFWYQKPQHVATSVDNGHEDNCPTKEGHPSQRKVAQVLALVEGPLGHCRYSLFGTYLSQEQASLTLYFFST